MKKSMKKIALTFIMAVIILTGITALPAQKASAAETVLNVNNKWSSKLTTSENTALYKFKVPSDGILTWQVLNGNPNNYSAQMIYSYIWDNNMVSLASSYVSGGGSYISSESIVLSAGTYYIRLKCGINDFTYKIRLNFQSYNTNDQKAGSLSSPQTIKIGQKIVGALTATDREDWYKIKITKPGSYIYTIVSEGSFYTTLRNGASTLQSQYIGGSSGNPNLNDLTYELEAGTYYIRIYPYSTSSTGKYEFTLAAKPCSHTYTTKVIKPTYFSKGYTKKTCTQCGKVVKSSYVARRTIARETIRTLSAGTKKLTVTWKTISDVTGYEIRCSTDKNFKKSVSTTVIKKNSTSKKTISKLKSKKTYYVQVRAYAAKGGTTVYGKWSTAKKVTTK